MKKNVGKTDKLVRYALAVVFLVGGILLFNTLLWLSVVLFVLTAAMVITGTVGVCGLYKLFGINTCKIENKE